MNPLVKKEIRLLMPSWIAAMALAVAPVWLFWKFDKPDMQDVPLVPGFAFLLGILFLAIAPFGQEFSFKTFSNSLAQPAPRRRLWLVKTGTLVVAFLSALAAGVASWAICPWRNTPSFTDALADNFRVAALGMMAVLSGGLWTALLFRQVTAAFWFTLLTPAALSFWVSELSDHFRWSDGTTFNVFAVVFGLYAVAGFFGARRLFFRAQDTQWTGGNILFLRRRKSAGHSTAIIPGGLKNRFIALVWKEIQLHEINLLIAAILLLLHLGTLPFRLVVSNSTLKMVFDQYWSLWLLMPLLIGGAAVAEERKLGTLESQLCLPARRSAQFSIKFFIGLILSLLLGAAVPSIIEHSRNFGATGYLNYWIFGYAGLVFFISFYASTLARSTLQALGMAIGIPLTVFAGLFAFVTLAVEHSGFFGGHYYAGWIYPAAVMAVLSLPLILARLMFWNFKWLHRDWKLWRHNLMVFLTSIVVICILASAIYYRSWELLMPADYPHGPARLNNSQPPKLSYGGNEIYAVLPNGRLWVVAIGYYYINPFGFFGVFHPDGGRFISGSNWTDVASSWLEAVAIKSDGSLWAAPEAWPPSSVLAQTDFKRIGSDTNWQQAAFLWQGFVLLKTDGSLWLWGTNRANNYIQKQNLDFRASAVRFGDGTNWTQLLERQRAKKSDGSIWKVDTVDSAFHLIQETNAAILWQDFTGVTTGVGTNGELWIASQQWVNGELVPLEKFRLGSNMKWKAATIISTEDDVIALRSDGTLWKWSPIWELGSDPSKIHGTQLGNHSDWTAPLNSWNGWSGIVLAADGSLWSWEIKNSIWLSPSRKPIYLGNIFGKAN